MKHQVSIDLGVIIPITINEYKTFSIKYINIPKSQSINKYQKKKIESPHYTNNLYQPLKHQKDIWSKTEIKHITYYVWITK